MMVEVMTDSATLFGWPGWYFWEFLFLFNLFYPWLALSRRGDLFA